MVESNNVPEKLTNAILYRLILENRNLARIEAQRQLEAEAQDLSEDTLDFTADPEVEIIPP